MKDIEAKDKKKLDAILKKYDFELIAGKPPKKKPLWIKPYDTIYEYLKHQITLSYFSMEVEKFHSFKYTDALELAKIILFLGRLLNGNLKQEYAVRMEYDIQGLPYKCTIKNNPYFILKMYQAAQKILKEEDSLFLLFRDKEEEYYDDEMEFSKQEIKFIINKLGKKPKTDIQALGTRAYVLQNEFNLIGLLSNVGTEGRGIVKELAFLYDFINELIKGNDISTFSNKEKSDKIKYAINSYLKWKQRMAIPENEDLDLASWTE